FIHGEGDEVTLLSDMIEWAKPQRHLVTVLPGANHFFTGYLKQLRIAMTRYLALG
ncbi:MAG: hydrolase, partial [Gammaproteobacteria bacterium]|nr:hydrolase [Gammaproteobacteria bacterium]